jgi:phosphoglycerate kinase
MHLLRNADVKGKNVFLRADLDVPIIDGKIDDDTRLLSVVPTIKYLLTQNAKIILSGHLGRPKGVDKSLSLEPIVKWFAKHFHDSRFIIHDSKLGDFDGWEIGQNIFLLENLRFNEGEENFSASSGLEFAKKLAGLADIYVNDAFAMCHRSHTSIVGITKFLPHFAGLHLEKELRNLESAMKNPKRPLVVIIGGKKIETKLPLVEKMHRIADYVLVGGKIAEETKILIKVQHEKIIGSKSVLLVADLTPDNSDITPKDAENFLQIIGLAKTIIWNGSMGITNQKSKIKNQKLDTERGTRLIAEGIMDSKAYSIVGGGDTVEFLNKLGILAKFSFASTGGGAMLSLLSGEKLPGIEALLK